MNHAINFFVFSASLLRLCLRYFLAEELLLYHSYEVLIALPVLAAPETGARDTNGLIPVFHPMSDLQVRFWDA